MPGRDMTLAVRIRGDASQLHGELEQTGARVRTIMASIAGAFGVGFGAAAFVRSIRGAMDYAAALRDVATQAEITTEQVQAMREAGLQNASSDQQIEQALMRVQAARAAAADGNETLMRSFRALGLSDVDVQLDSTAVLIEKIGAALVGTDSRSREYAAALEIIGRRASAVIPALRAIGEEGLGSFADALRETGRLLDDEFLAALDRAEKAGQRFTQRWRGFLGEIWGGIEFVMSDTGEGEDFLKKVEARAEAIFERMRAEGRAEHGRGHFMGPGMRNVAREQARDEIRSEMAAEKEASEAAARAQDEEALRDRSIAAERDRAAEIEQERAEQRLTDAERLAIIERRIAQAKIDAGEEEDELERARIQRRIAEMEQAADPIRGRMDREQETADREQERRAERSRQFADRLHQDQRKKAQDLAEIQAGRGIQVSSAGPADALAAIGGYVGGQADASQAVAERQLAIQERMAEYLRRMAEPTDGFTGVTP